MRSVSVTTRSRRSWTSIASEEASFSTSGRVRVAGGSMADELRLIEPHEADLIAEADSKELVHPPVFELLELERTAVIPRAALPTMSIGATCSKQHFPAKRASGRRPLSQIKWIVIHSTEGGTALGAAMWFRNPTAGGSAHLCLDDDFCYRTLGDDVIPWGAQGANYHGFHIEQAGFARWIATMWSKTHRRTLMRSAYKTALHCRRYGIPVRFVTAAQLKQGVSGITTHNECSKAFGGTHWDPGSGWPRRLFMTMVRGYFNGPLRKVKKIA